MRDKLAHGYFGTDYSIIWQTIKSDLPKVLQDINIIFNDLNNEG